MKNFLHELDFWFFWIIPSYISKGKLTVLLQEMLPKSQIFHCWAAWWIKSHDSKYWMHWRILLIGYQLLLLYKFLVHDNIRRVSQYQVPAVDNAKFYFWQHLLMATPINSEIAQYESKKLFFFKIVSFYERHLQFLNCWYEFLHSAKICFVGNFL